MHDDRAVVEKRLDRILAERLRPAVHTRTHPLDIAAWHVPGEPVPAHRALHARYTPVHIGHEWGPAWGTTWFRLTGTLPETWADQPVEAVIDLGFDLDRPRF
ncbi:alpha-mannosidase, partial [Saccharopolyspora sp. 6T]|nr:alpha-mannosidase [Saccharopolyspora sp. 6T]